jgi:AbrB family looped-hinge helix DNA binding protein
MTTLTVTAKGQITLRKDILRHLGVQPGETLVVEKLPGGRISARAARPSGQITDVFNLFEREGRPSLSVEEMNQIARDGWAGRR